MQLASLPSKSNLTNVPRAPQPTHCTGTARERRKQNFGHLAKHRSSCLSGLTVIIIGQEETTTTSDPSTATLLYPATGQSSASRICLHVRANKSRRTHLFVLYDPLSTHSFVSAGSGKRVDAHTCLKRSCALQRHINICGCILGRPFSYERSAFHGNIFTIMNVVLAALGRGCRRGPHRAHTLVRRRCRQSAERFGMSDHEDDDEEEDPTVYGRTPPKDQMSMMRYKHKSHTRSHLLKELRSLNVTAKELRGEGHSLNALKDAGYSLKELRNAGYSLEELKAANVTKQLRASGFTIAELKKAGYDLADFHAANYSAKEMRTASIDADEHGGTNTKRAMGYTVVDLKGAGYMMHELQAAGYTCAELKAGGFKPKDLRAAGFTVKTLRRTGCTTSELKGIGFTLADLKLGGCQIHELKNANFTNKDLMGAGFTEKMIKNHGV